jgi:hypothetical protein
MKSPASYLNDKLGLRPSNAALLSPPLLRLSNEPLVIAFRAAFWPRLLGNWHWNFTLQADLRGWPASQGRAGRAVRLRLVGSSVNPGISRIAPAICIETWHPFRRR